MGTHWPPYLCLSAQGTSSVPSGRLRDEAKAYLQAPEVGLREALTAPKGKCAREKELPWFLGDTRVFSPLCHGKRPSAAEGSRLGAKESKGRRHRDTPTQTSSKLSPL